MNLKGKTLFITGSSRGIGLAIAKRAADDGANVAIIDDTLLAQHGITDPDRYSVALGTKDFIPDFFVD